MCTAGIRLVTDEDVQKSGDSGVIYIISVIQMIDLSMSYTYCVTKSTIAQTKQRLCNAWWNMVVSRICSSATGRYHGARQCGFRVRPSVTMARGNLTHGRQVAGGRAKGKISLAGGRFGANFRGVMGGRGCPGVARTPPPL